MPRRAPRRNATTCTDLHILKMRSARAGVAVCSAGLLAVLATLTTAAAGAQSRANEVTVTITNAKVKVSAVSVPVGLVVFKVVNKAKLPHNFTIAGKATSKIAAGRSATLQVKIANKGPYVYYSVGPGRQGASRGAISVVEPCTHPTSSTVTVQMAETLSVLSRTTVPCGTVTFAVTNVGTIVHSPDLFQANPPRTLARGPELQPGQTASLVVRFTQKGQVEYRCGEEEHDEMYGESVVLTVT
jgi:plastocyanin